MTNIFFLVIFNILLCFLTTSRGSAPQPDKKVSLPDGSSLYLRYRFYEEDKGNNKQKELVKEGIIPLEISEKQERIKRSPDDDTTKKEDEKEVDDINNEKHLIDQTTGTSEVFHRSSKNKLMEKFRKRGKINKYLKRKEILENAEEKQFNAEEYQTTDEIEMKILRNKNMMNLHKRNLKKVADKIEKIKYNTDEMQEKENDDVTENKGWEKKLKVDDVDLSVRRKEILRRM